MNATASGKPLKVNCFRIASPSSVHPFSVLIRCSISSRKSFGILLGPPGAYFVETQPRRFNRVERILLQLDRRRSFGRTGKRAASHRAVVGAFGLLQGVEGGRVLVLPLEPP